MCCSKVHSNKEHSCQGMSTFGTPAFGVVVMHNVSGVMHNVSIKLWPAEPHLKAEHALCLVQRDDNVLVVQGVHNIGHARGS